MSDTESDIEDLPDDYLVGEEVEEENPYDEEVIEEELVPFRTEDFISGPFCGDDSTIPINILEFDFSYSYDCKKYYNMVVADPNTIMFISGNLINFFNVEKRQLTFRRCAFGGGLGHMTKNPNEMYQHIAIAENGEQPPIIIYEWPSLEIVCLLRGGTAKCYNHLNYSPNGELLVSQGGEPDHLITVWNWPKARILLRTKSNVHDVYRVLFSPYVPGHLTTCGLSHIKFWKMAKTFTGLKLQGELGRFGKTEYSDILGIYPMPDEKVISGSYWGNFLVWEAGLIKLEVFRKLRKKCHEGPVVQFDFKDGELWTVSMDGRIRVWHYDTIDQADPPDEDRVVQLEPMYDFHTPNVQFMCIAKRSTDPEDTFYYAQDGNGGLWKIDLTTELNVQKSIQLYECHAGAVVDVAASPCDPYLASFGEDGRIFFYNYVTQTKLFRYQFPAKGVCMEWPALNIEKSGQVIILGFDDGNVRLIFVDFDDKSVAVVQIIKPHHKTLTYMSINPSGTILVTSGEDQTIFVFQIDKLRQKYITLVPIGYLPTTDIVSYITWHKDDDETVIVGCLHGFVDLIKLPTEPQKYTTITYILKVEAIHQRFFTYKAQIRRDIKIREIEAKKAIKREKKRVEMEKFKKENPGLEVDEEIFLADSESEEELEPLFIPEIPNRILWIQHTSEDTLWLSVAGYDAGYIYEYEIGQKEEIPYRFKMVHEADDIEISSFVYNYNRRYLIFAMENGAIRINRVQEDFTDLSDYWQLSMHDNYKGFVPKMCFSYDEKYFFTCGHDGNVFSYKFYPEDNDYKREISSNPPFTIVHCESIYDDDSSYTALSLEQAIVKAEEDRKTKLANDHKKEYLDRLFSFRREFSQLLKRNNKLLPTQIIPRSMLELDPRITNNLQEKLDAELGLVKRKLAFDVEKAQIGRKKLMQHFIDPLDLFPITVQGVNNYLKVTTLRQRKLDPEFFEMHLVVDQKIIEAELKGRPPERPPVVTEVAKLQEKKKAQLEYFLLGLSQDTIHRKLGSKLSRLLEKYRARKFKLEKRQLEWEKFNQTKPIPGVNHPDDEAVLAEAMDTIGDYKLKSADDYKVPRHLRESTVKKYKQLLNMRQKQYDLRHGFNVKVHKLRSKKVRLREALIQLTEQLNAIHREIPEEHHINGPSIIELQESDFPEKNLEVVVDVEEPGKNKNVQKVQPIIVLEPTGDILEKEVLPCLEGIDFYDDEEEISPWEEEAKRIRLKRKLFEQQLTIQEMNAKIQSFDDAIEDIYNMRLQVAVDATFMDLHLLTLNQELLILTKSEAVEDKYTEKVHAIMEEMLDMRDIIRDSNNKIEARKRDIETLEDKGKLIQQRFQAAAGDNKFYDFLRRIFKKKYKPPKVKGPDDSDSESDSSSSSSSSDDDEDAGSIDSRDVGPIRLDDSVCPKGCDQTLYDLTFELRSQRHAIELEIKEHNRVIEQTKKDMELIFKKLKSVEINLKQSQDELETFQREKQQKLNQVLCTVVLKLHQLQHFKSDHSLNNVKDTLIFSKHTLSQLYKRVGMLQAETLQQKEKHKLNISHLARMKTDCKHMQSKIQDLNMDIEEALKRKFGRTVDLDEIQEALLKKLIFDLRMSMLDISSLYEEELRLWRTRYSKKQTELRKAIRENTAKLELLALLNNEKTKLTRIIQHQGSKRVHLDHVAGASEEFKQDITKLSEIAATQRQELQMLKEEIKILKTKGLQPVQDVKELFKHDEMVEEEELLMELDETDSVIEFDYEPTDRQAQYVSIIPKYTESIMVAKEILIEMLQELCIEGPGMPDIDELVSKSLHKESVAEIIDELLANLPYELQDKDQSILEIAAEKLYALKETTSSEMEPPDFAAKVLQEILDKTIIRSEATKDVAEMLEEIVRHIPLGKILNQEILDAIVEKIMTSEHEIPKEELISATLSITSVQREQMEVVLQHVLEAVYGSGLDYLYYIKDD